MNVTPLKGSFGKWDIYSLALIVCGRFAYRLYLLERNTAEAQRKATTNVMVIGIGSIGQFARKQLEQDAAMKVACVVSGAEEWPNQYLNGVPVIGLKNLAQVMEQKKIGYVVIADETLTEEATKQIKALCDKMKVEVQDFIEYLQSNKETYHRSLYKEIKAPFEGYSFSIPQGYDEYLTWIHVC